MKKKSIDEKILDYMKQGNKISQWDAYELFNYTRLSATIFNLKADGHNIKDEWVKNNGKKFKRYWLVLDDDGEQMGLGLNVTKKFRFPD